MFCDFPKFKHTKQTIYRGVGGGGNATTDAEISTIAALNTLGAASATASAASATQAATSASNASTSATTAGGSATTASTQASAASSSASSASTSAGTATTQASNASSSASAAATSASNAAASAASIAGGPVASVAGLTGTVSSAALKTATALNNVDNTSDANKPISSLTATALAGKQASGSYATGSGTANGTNTGDQTITLTGGVTGTGTGSFAATVVTNANLTGAVTSTGNATSLGSFTSANLATALTDETGTGAAVFANSPNLVTPALGTPTSGVATNLTGLPLTTGVTGTLPVANGGTGQTTANTAFNALAPSQTSANGQYLTSNGTNTSWVSVTSGSGTVSSVAATVPAFLSISGSPITTTGTLAVTYSGTALPVANGGTGVTTSTGTGDNVLSTSPTLVTPVLGTPTALVGTNITGTASSLTSGITAALKSATTTVDVSAATAPTTGQVLTATSSTAATWQAAAGGSSGVPYMRQTVFSGSVDTSGLPAFGGSTGSTTVTTSGTLVMTAANGLTDRQGTKVNPAWSGLSTNGTMYLYADVNANGTITEGAGTLAPIYQWGGTPANTSGLFTYNIQQAQGFIGTGAAAPAGYRVFVGEVTVAGSVVTAITWYQLQGRYRSTPQAIVSAGLVSLNHNIGVNPDIDQLVLICGTTDNGFLVGDRITMAIGGISLGADTGVAVWSDTKALSARYGSSSPCFRYNNKSSGSNAALTNTSWTVVFSAKRGW